MKFLILLLVTLLIAAVSAAPGTNATCLQSCPPGGPYNPNCCNCCPGGTCSGNGAEFTTCCTKDQDFCGCISSRAFCSGRTANGANLESTFGTCYTKGTGVCAYEPSPNVWILCPVGTTGCISGSTVSSCCTSSQTCNRITGACEASGPATCNGQAYDPSTYTCAINSQGQQVLCPAGSPSACGSACYNPSQYCCQSGQLRQPGQCSAQTSATTQTTQTTQTTTTATTATTQPPSSSQSGPATCNGQVYDKTNYDCPTNDQGKQVLCPKGNSACGTACYNPSQYCCQSGALRQSGQCSAQTSATTQTTQTTQTTATTATTQPPSSSQSGPATCNGQVYDKTNYDCPTNDQGQQVLCPKGNSACGSACYNPSSYCCQAGQLRQPGQCSGSQTCSSGETYNPATSFCCSSVSDSTHKVCPVGQHCCGNILNGTNYYGPGSLYTACYNPAQYKCCYGGTSSFLNPATIEPISYQIPPGAVRVCQS